jgi:hypothetical protein
MNTHNTPDSLPSTLAQWRIAVPRTPEFRARVWARIGVSSPGWATYARSHLATVTAAFVLAIAVGAFTGREQAQARRASDSARLATAYVQSMDARLMQMP